MELGAIFWTSLVVGFSGAMMPGPLLTLTVGETARRGFWAGPLLVLGHALLEILLVLLLILGAAEFLASERVTAAIALVGGAFLIFMGWSMCRDVMGGRVFLELAAGSDRGDDEKPRRGLHPVPAGILVSLSNPYWSLWWATVGLAYVITSLSRGTTGLVVFLSGHLLADLIWYSLVSGAVAGGRHYMGQHVYRGMIAVCGVFLAVLGVYFVVRGIA